MQFSQGSQMVTLKRLGNKKFIEKGKLSNSDSNDNKKGDFVVNAKKPRWLEPTCTTQGPKSTSVVQ